ncbi:autotransporter-associated beta strand repeat-containing protein [Plebeiibacterium marinum]|uniref:Autotransporter-associated beta strand repeat-containing protein n=1 Tax=Plebeiibacterium marinum TaxID=2992111 RepID=A0AAE3SK91_9BACT|nr:autotransporter-associated beta strand repeat-containing protein [Plebeiobacterium marinum]MCW3806362.1 autotransporter-associated beta strand repeat-containing protein [Plebeiobacterium marinum]
MNKIYFLVVALLISQLAMQINGQQLAFPGAEGFGKYAVGGRYGSVYHVTNLNDSGTGSLRDAVSQSNRIVVFDVGGVIKIGSTLIVKSNIYLAGQTAPGEGITVYGNRVSFSGANNSICRYMKFRMGEKYGDSGKDALGVANGVNMIFDHCSISWGRDETFSINWDGKGTEPANITIQNCIIAQGLMSHSAGGLIQTNGGVTLYRNLYVDNDTRNNKVKGVNQYVNNLVYNWRSAAYIMGGDSEGHSYANCVSNYFIKGPDDGSVPLSGANENFHLYADDNWYDGNKDGSLNGSEVPFSDYSGGPDFQDEPYDYPLLPTVGADEVFESVLPGVGASLPCRDYVDYYVVNEVKSLGNNGKIITSEEELPFGAPESWLLWSGTARVDSDNDGIPDEWENNNGLNASSSADAMAIASNGYANIENYINSISQENTQAYLRKPLNLRLASSTQTSLTLEWYDYTEQEEGYIIEREVSGVFTPIGSTVANVYTFTVTDLSPEEQGTFRVKAYNSSIESEYSETLTCKTLPVPVEVLDIESFVEDFSWNATVNYNWDETTANWLASGESTTYSENSAVLFGNMEGDQSVTLAEQVEPSAMVVDADNDYTFSGSYRIAGGASVNKTGTGTLTLATNNSYTGATVIHDGVLQISRLANGGARSSIGASQNYDFNWVWLGGMINYTGTTVSTDRSVALDGTTAFSVQEADATVTITGNIGGQGGLTKAGAGNLFLTNENPYAGETTVSQGTLELNGMTALTNTAGMGTSGKVVMNGGRLKLSGGESANYETYTFGMEVAAGKHSYFQVDRTCYLKGNVSGEGTLDYDIYYVREYIQGDWSLFSGTINANGLGTTSDGNQFLLNNTKGIPNARVVTSGTTKIICWKNASTMWLGGLSGTSGTMLAGADKQNNSATMTWVVGGAGTNETFHGVINNECSNRNYNGRTSIIKEGTGYWRLTGYNIYSGSTRITDGKLIVNGTNTSTAATTVEGGMLAGQGRLYSRVTVQAGAGLEPGDGGISTLSVAGLTLNSGSYVNMDLDATNTSNDKVSSTSGVLYNGILNLNITGELKIGDSFTLFSASGHTGSFEEIVPAIPGDGMQWDFTNGVLSVEAATSVYENSISSMNIYPNPVQDLLHIDLGPDYAEVQLSLVTATGKEVLNQIYKGGEDIVLPVEQLQRGIYFINLDVDKVKITGFKVIKK